MKKRTYICPRLKSVEVELQNVIADSIPIVDGEGDQQLSKGYSSIWSCMKADNDAAAAQQADEEDEDF